MRKADLTTLMCRMSWKSESLNLLEPSGPHRACYGTALPFTYIYIYIYIHIYTHIHTQMEDSKRTIQAPPLNPYTLCQYNANLPTELHWIMYHQAMCDGNIKVEDLTDNVNKFWVKVHAHAIRFIYKTVTLNLFVSAKWDIWMTRELPSIQLFIGFY